MTDDDIQGLIKAIKDYVAQAMQPYIARADEQGEHYKGLRDQVMHKLGALTEAHGQLADAHKSGEERLLELSDAVVKTQQSMPDVDAVEQRLQGGIDDLRAILPSASDIRAQVLEDVRAQVDALEVPDDRIDAAIDRHAARMELALERRFNDLVERAYDRLPKPDDVRAVESMEVRLLDDERTLEIDLGVYGRKQVKLAHPVYRGVWGDGGYDKGDTVTWAGSTWIAERDTTGKPGAKDSGWRLSVKKGRDGQDGATGKIPEGERLTAREVKTLRALLAKHEERNQ